MRKLKLDEAYIDKCLEVIKKQLLTGGITYSAKDNIKIELSPAAVEEDIPKPVLELSNVASLKLWALVNTQATKEIAWHGTVVRTENGFRINDIILFPQVTTGATASGDDVKYNEWLLALDDDTFDALRFHGHSHVKMNTDPSGTDTAYQDNLLKDVKDFYIFGIFNQFNKFWLRIYDIEHGYVFDTADISFKCPQLIAYQWAELAIKEYEIKPQITTPTPAYNQYSLPYTNSAVSPRQTYYDQIKRETNPELYGKERQETKGNFWWNRY